MKLAWLILLGVIRTLYFAYSLWCLLFLPFVIGLLLLSAVYALGWTPADCNGWCLKVFLIGGNTSLKIAGILALVCAIFIALRVFAARDSTDPNPFQSAFMAWFGTLKWFWNTKPPMKGAVGLPSGNLLENPGGYKLTGLDIRQVLDNLQCGDILLRGYDGYLDGAFIRYTSLCGDIGFRPGWFSHAAIYVAQIAENDKPRATLAVKDAKSCFATGPQMVVHAMSKGVHAEDILTFCRCDYLAILRLKDTNEKTNLRVNTTTAIQNAKAAAIEKIGEKYDFNFDGSPSTGFNRLSCAELVYYCYHSVGDAIRLKPKLHGLYPLGVLSKKWSILKRETVTPDDFYDLCLLDGTLDLIWIDQNSKKRLAMRNAA